MARIPRIFVTAITLGALALGLAGCSGDAGTEKSGDGGKAEGSKTLVVYTPNEQNMLDALFPTFEEETGIKIQTITAGTGELYQRIRSEAANPQGDVMFGGGSAQAVVNEDLWEPYVSANDGDMLELGKNIGGFCTPYQADGSNLLVNTDLGGDLGIAGYADLLKPELKGKIAFGDPTDSSSAFAQLTNILAAMGGYDSDEAWAFVEQLIQQLDGKVIGGSTQVAQDTANGEFVVALTYEPLSVNFVESGSPVEIVYPSEGAVFIPAGAEIIKGAKNMDAAQQFLDFLTSEAAQKIIATETSGRPLRDGVESELLKPLSDIETITEDGAYVAEHREEIAARYQKLLEENL